MALDFTIRSAKEFLFDCLFPKNCLGCEKEGSWLCSSCFEKLEIKQAADCPFCSASAEKGIICKNCADVNGITQLLNVGFYRDTLLQKLIHYFKYQYIEELVSSLEKLIDRFFIKYPELQKMDYNMIVPIPLHKRRLLERNFNQSEVLSRILSKKTGIDICTNALQRIKNTPPQAQLTDSERPDNIRGAFHVNDIAAIKGKTILLVDDVFTTGSTVREAAKALLAAGATRVGAWVIARRS